MIDRDKSATAGVDKRTAGPQGTRLFSADELRVDPSEFDPQTNARASVGKPVLEGISAGFEGRRVSLPAGRQTIGRHANNDIVIEDPSVSSSHAWIINQRGHCVVMNTLSTNGTFVNDKRLHEAVLKHGDRIRLGHAEFVFLTREPDAAGRVWLRRLALALLLLTALGALVWRLA